MGKKDLYRIPFPKKRKVLTTFGEDLLLTTKHRGLDEINLQREQIPLEKRILAMVEFHEDNKAYFIVVRNVES